MKMAKNDSCWKPACYFYGAKVSDDHNCDVVSKKHIPGPCTGCGDPDHWWPDCPKAKEINEKQSDKKASS